MKQLLLLRFQPVKTGSRGCGIAYRLYILHKYQQWHSWTESDWSCDVGDRDSLLSSGKGGKDGKWREWRRENCVGVDFPAPSHSLSILPVFLHPPTPCSVPSNPLPEMHTLPGIWGAHTRVCGSVCLCMRTCEMAKEMRQTEMHVRLPRIRHPGTPLLFFSLTLTFVLFFLLLLFSNFIWVFWFLVQKSY